jgi:anti-sigma regulatory factor (Ser/Thr protein kinase)
MCQLIGLARKRDMDIMTAARPAVRHSRRIPLTAGPAAAAAARSQVQAAIRAWDVPVDPAVAVLLASELVTNAITHTHSGTILVALTCGQGELRVDVHDTSVAEPALVDAPADAESGRGLLLVHDLSAEWGWYRTTAGKAVYFTLSYPVRGPVARPRSA